jgi:type I restriction enzyme M protein
VAKKTKSIESTLWSSANKLRGSVEWGEYKHIILSLLFLKFADVKFNQQRDQLINEGKEKYIDKVEFYSQDNIFFLPEIASWQYLIDHASNKDISQKIDIALAEVEKNNPTLSGALPSNYFTRIDLATPKVKKLLDDINNLDHEMNNLDLIGRVYEYFLSKFSQKEGKEGQYYTPKHVVKLMNALINPSKGIIYDPCAGTGGMFVQTVEYLKENQIEMNDVSFYGQESISTTYKLARMNLAIRGIPHNFGTSNADTFQNDLHKDIKTDFIIANPPFNQKGWRSDNELLDDIRWKDYPVPLPGNANYAWILHMIHKMNNNSQAAFLLANGALEDADTYEIRKKILENDLVEAVITLPRNVFYGTDISVTLWILNKNKEKNTEVRNNITFEYIQRKNKIVFMDLRKCSEKIDKYIVLTDKEITNVVENFTKWRQGNFIDQDEFARGVDLEEIIKNDYSLVPSRYINFKNNDLNIDFDKEMNIIAKNLSENKKIQEDAMSEIKKSLKHLGYEI